MDLQQLIDEAEQPPPLRLQHHLALGRRAVRRRRVTTALGAGAASVAVVAAALAWGPLASETGQGPASSSVATSPRPARSTPASSDVPSAGRRPEEFRGGQAAAYDLGGRLRVRTGWRITQRIARPVTAPVQVNGLDSRVPDRSVGLEVTTGRRTQWILTWWSRQADTSFTDYQPTGVGPRDLQAFLDIEVALQTGQPTDAVATVSATGVMTGRNGVQVVDQRATPQLDRAGATTAVAKVRFPGAKPIGGWILLVRSSRGVRTYPLVGYPVANSTVDNGPDTVGGFASWVAPRVEEGRYP